MVFRNKTILNARLLCAAGFVRRGAALCDVGCDHAYLPIFLCKAGIVSRAMACDINEGPCERARENIRQNGCSGMIEVVRADGLSCAEDFAPTDVVICGMGGELIAKIIFASVITRKKGVRLILQPMTKAPALRLALVSHGFEIVDEALAEEDRIYQIIVAEYTGKSSSLSETEALVGPVVLRKQPELFGKFIEKQIKTQKQIMLAKRLHRVPYAREERLVSLLTELIENTQETNNPC